MNLDEMEKFMRANAVDIEQVKIDLEENKKELESLKIRIADQHLQVFTKDGHSRIEPLEQHVHHKHDQPPLVYKLEKNIFVPTKIKYWDKIGIFNELRGKKHSPPEFHPYATPEQKKFVESLDLKDKSCGTCKHNKTGAGKMGKCADCSIIGHETYKHEYYDNWEPRDGSREMWNEVVKANSPPNAQGTPGSRLVSTTPMNRVQSKDGKGEPRVCETCLCGTCAEPCSGRCMGRHDNMHITYCAYYKAPSPAVKSATTDAIGEYKISRTGEPAGNEPVKCIGCDSELKYYDPIMRVCMACYQKIDKENSSLRDKMAVMETAFQHDSKMIDDLREQLEAKEKDIRENYTTKQNFGMMKQRLEKQAEGYKGDYEDLLGRMKEDCEKADSLDTIIAIHNRYKELVHMARPSVNKQMSSRDMNYLFGLDVQLGTIIDYILENLGDDQQVVSVSVETAIEHLNADIAEQKRKEKEFLDNELGSDDQHQGDDVNG